MKYDIFIHSGGRRDILTGRRRNKAHKVSFSNKKSRKWQDVNIQSKKLYWSAGERFVQLRISANTIRTIDKKCLDSVAKGFGINLWKLPFKDMRQRRLEYLATRPIKVPRPKELKNTMKDFKHSDKSSIKRKKPSYIDGRIFWVREDEVEEIHQLIKTRKETERRNGKQN